MDLYGIAVSGGIGFGKIYVFDPQLPQIREERASDDGEKERFSAAVREAGRQLAQTRERLAEKDPDQAQIFDAHAELLEDEEILEEIDCLLSDGFTACWAVESVFSSFADILESSGDEMIRQRGADLRDVKKRLLRCLLGIPSPDLSQLSEPVIIAAKELNPSDTASMDAGHIAGIAAEQGGTTSHVAILAKTLGIPTVLGIDGLLSRVKHGEVALLDAEENALRLGSGEELESQYQIKAQLFREKAERLAKYTGRSGRTADGTRVYLGANIGSAETGELFSAQDADFVGLFRSEFLYMHADHLPTEEEQFEAYKKALSAMNGRRVTIRTLDIGGDKQLPYLPQKPEMNPFLGLRALRLCLERPELFRTQLRALLRASVYGKLDIMFPMVSGLEEFRQARDLTLRLAEELRESGFPVADDVRIGLMIEIPSIALMADQAAAEADFASVGTNDLCQYLTAADRGNPDVSRYYQSYHPALFRTLEMIARAFNAAGKELSVCGELGGDAKAAPVLVGLGIRKLSMNPAAITEVKAALDALSLADMEGLAREVCGCTTAKETERIITKN